MMNGTGALRAEPASVILVVDDDANIRAMARIMFKQNGHRVVEAQDGHQAISLFQEMQPEVILMDVNMPGLTGIEACSHIRKLPGGATVPILLITAMVDAALIDEGFAAGATDYITKPLHWPVLRQRTLHLARIAQAERKLAGLQQFKQAQDYIEETEKSEWSLVGNSPSVMEVRELIARAAAVSSSILITGETGTGKGLVARTIHHAQQSKGPFISVNCAALPESLIEAELFGAEKGAYTGATATRKGVFELAHGGTLFLDEIGEMPIALQSKLLSVLEEHCIKRLGGERSIPVRVRIIAATNSDPEAAIRQGKLRQDLYYRLNVLRLPLPSLAERRIDIPALARHFIRLLAPGRALTLAEDECSRLQAYHWPGNVRELRNVIERSLILANDEKLYPSRLLVKGSPPDVGPPPAPAPALSADLPSLAEVERRHITEVFAVFQGNQTQTAKALGISLTTLKQKIKEYGLKKVS
ncbi:MAG: sigma-54 dependent transcriptional regulator [Blastocatellia bacterium]|nr:sigma-54 dependent transcriptional regulator [Blastocatellia bacterium]